MRKTKEEIEDELAKQGYSVAERGTFIIPLPDGDGEEGVHIDAAVIEATKALLKTAHAQMDKQNKEGAGREFIVTGKLHFGEGATLVIALSFTPPPDDAPEKPPVPFVNITGGDKGRGH